MRPLRGRSAAISGEAQSGLWGEMRIGRMDTSPSVRPHAAPYWRAL
jgi:hypothetical protein